MTVTHEPVAGWTEPTASDRLELLKKTKTIAMVGVSANSSRPSNFVATYLLSSSSDYEIHFVNPTVEEILGQPCHSTLEDLPITPDMVNVFRRSEDLPEVAEQAVAIGAQSFWTQLGLWNVEAATIAVQADLDLVMDRCLKVEHARFHGGLHLGGFDTGVIDSRLGK